MPGVTPDCTAHHFCSDAAEPLYFGADRRLFGWLHRPLPTAASPGTSGFGLVLCKPFGYESMCSHRSVREFAMVAASSGVPALRFDYAGSGDSADIDEDADQLQAWCEDVISAVGELRRRTGVQRVCLLGFRLGALLAALAAHACKSVDGLILIAPVTSGARYLRELLALQRAIAQAPGSETGPIRPTRGEAMEVIGFRLSAASVAALSRMDVRTLNPPAGVTALIIDRDDVPSARAWAQRWSEGGAPVEYRVLPGFVEMMMTPPLFAVPPAAMISATREWLLRRSRIAVPVASMAGPPAMPRPPPSLAAILKLPSAPAAPAVTERPVRLTAGATPGAGPTLFGVLAEPQGSRRRRAVILLNVGADHHIGPNRMYVALARRWARHGCLVLRLDLAGLGDSDSRPGHPDGEVYTSAALEDVRAAIAFMREDCGAREITLAGLCSGAYYALRAAVAGLAVDRILMVNPQTFFWREGRTLSQLQLAEVVRNPHLYRERLLSAKAWRRLLTGQVNLWRIVKIYLQRPLLALESWARDLSRWLRIRLPRDLGWDLRDVITRGVKVSFAFACDEPGIDLLRIQGGSSVRQLGELCPVRVIEGGDHLFSRSGPRAALMDVLTKELFDGDDSN